MRKINLLEGDTVGKLLSRIAVAAYCLIVMMPSAFAGAAGCDFECIPTTRVPEPATLALFAAGAGALAFARWRRRK